MTWVRHRRDERGKQPYEDKACSQCEELLPDPEDADIGDVWACPACGLLWRMYEYEMGFGSDYWWPAGWWTRMWYRNAARRARHDEIPLGRPDRIDT